MGRRPRAGESWGRGPFPPAAEPRYSEAEPPKLERPMKSENIEASTPLGHSLAARMKKGIALSFETKSSRISSPKRIHMLSEMPTRALKRQTQSRPAGRRRDLLNFGAAGAGLRRPRRAFELLRRRSGVRRSGLSLRAVQGERRMGRCRPTGHTALSTSWRAVEGEDTDERLGHREDAAEGPLLQVGDVRPRAAQQRELADDAHPRVEDGVDARVAALARPAARQRRALLRRHRRRQGCSGRDGRRERRGRRGRGGLGKASLLAEAAMVGRVGAGVVIPLEHGGVGVRLDRIPQEDVDLMEARAGSAEDPQTPRARGRKGLLRPPRASALLGRVLRGV